MKKNSLTSYFKASLEELTKVTWPTQKQAVRLTVIVMGFCVAIGVVLGGLDAILGKVNELILEFVVNS